LLEFIGVAMASVGSFSSATFIAAQTQCSVMVELLHAFVAFFKISFFRGFFLAELKRCFASLRLFFQGFVVESQRATNGENKCTDLLQMQKRRTLCQELPNSQDGHDDQDGRGTKKVSFVNLFALGKLAHT
jgi:hypothetical protein